MRNFKLEGALRLLSEETALEEIVGEIMTVRETSSVSTNIAQFEILLSNSLGYFANARDVFTGDNMFFGVGFPSGESTFFSDESESILSFDSYWGAFDRLSLEALGSFRIVRHLAEDLNLEMRESWIESTKFQIKVGAEILYCQKHSLLGEVVTAVFSIPNGNLSNLVALVVLPKSIKSVEQDLIDIRTKELLSQNPLMDEEEIRRQISEYRHSHEFLELIEQAEGIWADDYSSHIVMVDFFDEIVSLSSEDFFDLYTEISSHKRNLAHVK